MEIQVESNSIKVGSKREREPEDGGLDLDLDAEVQPPSTKHRFKTHWGPYIETLEAQYGIAQMCELLKQMQPDLVERLDALDATTTVYQLLEVFATYSWPGVGPHEDTWLNRLACRKLDALVKAWHAIVSSSMTREFAMAPSYGFRQDAVYSKFHLKQLRYLMLVHEVLKTGEVEALEFLIDRGVDLTEDPKYFKSVLESQSLAMVQRYTRDRTLRFLDLESSDAYQWIRTLPVVQYLHQLLGKAYDAQVQRTFLARVALHHSTCDWDVVTFCLDQGVPCSDFFSVHELDKGYELVQRCHEHKHAKFNDMGQAFIEYYCKENRCALHPMDIVRKVFALGVSAEGLSITPRTMEMYELLRRHCWTPDEYDIDDVYAHALGSDDLALVKALLDDHCPIPVNALAHHLLYPNWAYPALWNHHSNDKQAFRKNGMKAKERHQFLRYLITSGARITQALHDFIVAIRPSLKSVLRDAITTTPPPHTRHMVVGTHSPTLSMSD